MLASALVAGAVVSVSHTEANADTNIDQNTVRVDANDTLSEIAEHHHTTVAQLVKDNHIANQNLIHVGDKLVVTPGAKVNNAQPAQQSSQVASNNNQGQQAVQTTNTQSVSYTGSISGSDAAAKEWIAQHESGGSYTAQNSQYIGRYQLSASYLNGDYSPANQERVANNYVAQRYGSWTAAQSFWQSHGWY